MSKSRISNDVIEGVKACVVDKKNPGPCIDKVLEEAGIDQDQKAQVLTKVLKDGI